MYSGELHVPVKYRGVRMRLLKLSAAAVVFIWCTAAAQESDSGSLGSKITISGVVDFSMGEIMNGMYKAIISPKGPDPNQTPHSVSHVWFGNPLSRLNLAFQPSENFTAYIGFEGALFINTFPPQLNTKLGSNGATPLLPQFMDWRLHQAQGILSLLNNESASLTLSLGLMPYKYNPARNPAFESPLITTRVDAQAFRICIALSA
jgi:hypothetical protein